MNIYNKMMVAKKALKEKKDNYEYENKIYKITFIQRVCIFTFCNIICAICTYLILGIDELHKILIFGSLLYYFFPLLIFEFNSRHHILNE